MKEDSDMKQLSLKEYIDTSLKICDLIENANVGNAAGNKIALKETFRREIMKYAVFIAELDGNVAQNEIDFINETLGCELNSREIKMLDMEKSRFITVVPACLKYTVLADAGKKIENDEYNHQKSMIMYDAFKMFGETILSMHENDIDDKSMLPFHDYLGRMERFIKEYAVWYAGMQKVYRPSDIVTAGKESDEERAAKLEELLENLNSLTGLSAVKEQVNRLLNLIKVQKMREEKGMKCSDVSKHMVFSGNPGTGKTTVARMLAQIYQYMGVLKKGQLVEVDRSGLVRGYIGQTAERTQEVISEALGGILFIDEAYTLTVNKGEGDFGQEAVDTLLKAMEDYRDEIIVIVAGYTDLMEEFLNSNPGLKSRFSNFIFFEDYTAEEMYAILESMLKKQQYSLSDEAKVKAKEIFETRVANKPENFANARDVRNFMERAISNHAMRVVAIENADENVLSVIESEDLEEYD